MLRAEGTIGDGDATEAVAGDGEAVNPRIIAESMLALGGLCLLASRGWGVTSSDRITSDRQSALYKEEPPTLGGGRGGVTPDVGFALRLQWRLLEHKLSGMTCDMKAKGHGLIARTPKILAWLKPLKLVMFPRLSPIGEV